jgi:hypothetical protein
MNFSKWLKLDETLSLKGSYKGSIFQRLVAAKYKLAPTKDPSALEAFQDLARKISRQDEFLDSKFQTKPTEKDPYPSMKALAKDIYRQKIAGIKKPVVSVYSEPPSMDQSKTGHPAFSDEENIKQRGVHDIIAHFYGKHPFSVRGEYAAYNRHLKTLCNPQQVKEGRCLAAKAMFTEVVAQTSYYYIYNNFADQKAVILEDFDHYRVGFLSPSSSLNDYFVVENKIMTFKPNFSWEIFSKTNPQLSNELLFQEKNNKKLDPIFYQRAMG